MSITADETKRTDTNGSGIFFKMGRSFSILFENKPSLEVSGARTNRTKGKPKNAKDIKRYIPYDLMSVLIPILWTANFIIVANKKVEKNIYKIQDRKG